jgi:hypothetical protein
MSAIHVRNLVVPALRHPTTGAAARSACVKDVGAWWFVIRKDFVSLRSSCCTNSDSVLAFNNQESVLGMPSSKGDGPAVGVEGHREDQRGTDSPLARHNSPKPASSGRLYARQEQATCGNKTSNARPGEQRHMSGEGSQLSMAYIMCLMFASTPDEMPFDHCNN